MIANDHSSNNSGEVNVLVLLFLYADLILLTKNFCYLVFKAVWTSPLLLYYCLSHISVFVPVCFLCRAHFIASPFHVRRTTGICSGASLSLHLQPASCKDDPQTQSKF